MVITMSMFRTKRDVDRHVQESFRKLKSEEERNNRCYNIAKLYYNVGEYEAARRYVSSYLAGREDSSCAHKLLGQSLEALGQKDKALAEFKCSLELNGKQPELILKVCELIVATGTQLDLGRARFWCDRAEELFPHHPTVFTLKEHLLKTTGEEDTTKLEALILAEIGVRPTDVELRIRLLRLFLDSNRVKDAYEHAREIETRAAFKEHLTWYECLKDVFTAYKTIQGAELGVEFYAQYSAIMERIAVLNMQEQPASSAKRSLLDCVQSVFLFDQTLHQASQEKFPPNEQRYYEEYFTHLRGQLCLQLATLMLKRAKKEQSTWRETCRVAAPLLLGALAEPPDLEAPWLLHLNEKFKKSVQLWAKDAAFRRSQAGHVVLGLIRVTRTQFLEHVGRFCSGNWRERIYQRLFTARDHHHAIVTSHFVNHDSFARPPLELPSPSDLRPNDEASQFLHASSLHHQVWLGLQALTVAQKMNRPIDFRCLLFPSLQLTCINLQSAGVETLNRLDVDTFLYAAVLCSEAMHESHQVSGYWARDRPPTLPASISDQLCSVAQTDWWRAAYQIYTSNYKTELGTLRQKIQQGIEVVRAIGNHGLDARLMVRLATILAERAVFLSTQADGASEVPAIEARAALYWSAALPLLERMAVKQAIHVPEKRLFVYEGKDLSTTELENVIQDGRLYLAVQRMKNKEYEEALQEFNTLKSPYASFHACQIYTTLASDELRSLPRESITSEMRSKHIILLTKARDSIYLTLDRLNSPGVDKKHQLNALVNKVVGDIESKLNRIDPDVYRNDGIRDGSECESISDVQSAGDHNSLVGNGSLYPLLLTPRHRKNSTPYRSPMKAVDNSDLDYRRTEARPSPERLDAQIRQLSQIVSDRDAILQTVLDQNKVLMDAQSETNKVIVTELQNIKSSLGEISELKKQIQELQRETSKLRRAQMSLAQGPLPHDLAIGGEKEDELYVFDDEDYSELYTDEVNMAAAQLGQYPTFPPYPNYSNLRQITGLLGTSTVTYGQPPAPTPPLPLPPSMNSFFRNMDPSLLYPPALAGYYAHGALPFSEGQKLPDFRPPIIQPPLPQMVPHVVPLPEQKLLATAAPVNVVITSSDVMPTSAPAHQPTLSVTIPPQHRLGTVPPPLVHAETPHAFQISMPPQAPLHMASQLEKQSANLNPVLPISTNSLLVSVPSPLYSAVGAEKTPPKTSATATGSVSANNSFVSSPSRDTSREYQRLSTSSAAEDEDTDAYPDFKPVIPLPAEVAVNTGEEGEDVLFETRGKLYRFVDKEWKERGVGMIKFLQNRTSGKVRLLMRREQVLKICANHFLTPEMELSAMNNRAWIWVANDFADEEVRLEKLCARFKNVEEAHNFSDAFYRAREASKMAASPVMGGGDRDASQPAWKTAETSSVPSATSPTVAVSKPLIAPSKLGNIFRVAPTTSTFAMPSTMPTTTIASPKISVGGFTFVSPPTFKADTSKTIVEKAKSPEKPTEVAAPSPFAGFSFTTNTPQVKKADDQIPIIFGKPHVEVSSSQDNITKKEDLQSSQTNKEGSSHLFTSAVSSLGFSDIAFEDFTFKNDSSFKGFAGAGQTVFGSSPAAKKTEKSDNNESTDEFISTAEFVPVIPLPELVTVRTGEEDEEVLFEERAKLLRFDVESKQWKERGLGKFKILFDPKTGKVRLLQRREQVFKVCCNHMLTSYMEFSPLKTSDKAFSWYAQDYSEGEVKAELFALRFKTSEQATYFKSVIDKTQAKMVDDRLPVVQSLSEERCPACSTPNAGDVSHSKDCKKRAAEEETKYETSAQGDQPSQVDTTKVPLSQLFRPKSGSWECRGCYTRNDEHQKLCIACESPNPNLKAQSPAASQKPLSELFKPKAGSWECRGCYNMNDANVFACLACESAKPGHEVVQSKPSVPTTAFQFGIPKPVATDKVPLTELFKPKEGSWECKDCLIRNDVGKLMCPACNAPKPGSGEEVTKTTSATGSTLTFKASPSTGSFNLSSMSATTGFTFGIPQADPTKFSFGLTPSATPTSTAKTDFSFGSSAGGPSLLGQSPAKPFQFETKPATGTFLFGSSDSTSATTKTEGSTMPFSFGNKTQAEAKPEKASPFSFGPPSSAPVAIPGKDTTKSTDTSGPNFTFGSPVKFEFHFQAKSPKSPGRTTSTGEESDSEPEGDEGEHIYFQPVIPLPDKVPVCTGEEDEDVLYDHRAKLYRYASGEWKERGLGDFKLLKHKTTHKVRLLMRRDQILKLCLNHYLSTELNFVPKDDKTWLWSAADFSEGSIQNEQFALRFKTPAIATEFKDALDKALADLSTEETPASTIATATTVITAVTPTTTLSDGPIRTSWFSQAPPTTPTGTFSLAAQFGGTAGLPVVRSLFGGSPQQQPPKSPSDTTDSGQDTDVIFVEEILQVTPEEKEAALRLQLPPNFYSYRYKPGCPGCPGCETDSIDAEAPTEKATPTPSSQLPTLSELLRSAPAVSKPSLFGSSQSSAAPVFGQQVQASGIQSATPIFGQTAFQMPTANPVFGMKKPELGSQAPAFSAATSSSTDGLAKLESKFKTPISTFSFQAPAVKGFGFEKVATETNGFATLASAPSAKETSPEKSEADLVPFFPVDSKLSFSTLASSQQPAFKTDNIFTWAGTGTTMFVGSTTSPSALADTSVGTSTPSGADEGEGEEDGGEDDNHDPQFEPIIALPDTIEVRTGEEDEIRVFNHRAMLFRYQTATKEWKERGVGEIKILKHPVNKTYRLLMRREQIHKAVLNQLVTADLELKPLSTSDRAWCWGAYNHAEEPPALEELAVRFKTSDIAKDFYITLQQCIQEVKEEAVKGAIGRSPAKPEEEQQAEDDDEEDEDDEDEDGDEDDYEDFDDEASDLMFEKRATVLVQSLPNGPWENVGMGDLQAFSVFRDGQPYLSVYLLKDGKPKLLSHIDQETVLDLNKKNCSWSCMDCGEDHPPVKKLYMAKFSSESASGEFFTVLSERTTHYNVGEEDED